MVASVLVLGWCCVVVVVVLVVLVLVLLLLMVVVVVSVVLVTYIDTSLTHLSKRGDAKHLLDE